MNERNVMDNRCVRPYFERLGVYLNYNIRGEIKMITKDFSYLEFEQSDKARELGINNAIESQAIKNAIKSLVDSVLQPLRDAWGKPLAINSGYRCKELNAAVGGVPTSQHTKGEAADVCPFGRNGHGDIKVVTELARLAVKLDLPFDQMILYPSFVHFSHKLKGEQRKQILYNKSYKGEKV